MLVDTDVLIWYLRGDDSARQAIEALDSFCISAVTYMELVQGMRNKEELRILKSTLKSWGVKTLQINEEISIKAQIYVEEHYLGHSMQLADALIGATVSHFGAVLFTANDKHYRVIKDIKIKKFRP
jgi:predicted nucleic acid-binding protein